MNATSDTEMKPPDDPLIEFGQELDALIRRWSERTGGRCEMASRTTLVDEPPVDGFERFRRGPLVEITLTVVDMTRLDEAFDAYFTVPALSRALIEHDNRMDKDQTDRANAACS